MRALNVFFGAVFVLIAMLAIGLIASMAVPTPARSQTRPERKCTVCVRECGYSGLVVAQCSQRPTLYMQGCYCRSGI